MVYDPIRDCEVPSPAVEHSAHNEPWRAELQTPGSSFSDGRSRASGSRSVDGGREANGASYPNSNRTPAAAPPPAWGDSRESRGSPSRPNPSRSISGGLRGLLNDEDQDERRRSSSRTEAAWSSSDLDDGMHDQPQTSIHKLLNLSSSFTSHQDRSPPGGAPISKSNSASSFHSASPPSRHISPGQRAHHLDQGGFLTPATPVHHQTPTPHSNPHRRSSRSPHPSTSSISPGFANASLPLDSPYGGIYYGDGQFPPGPPSRRASTTSASGNPMPPPPSGVLPRQEYYDHSARSTPMTQTLPLRSPSVSVSPRSHNVSLPYPSNQLSTSRPGSSASANQPFSFQPPSQYPPIPSSVSPTTSARRLSEDPHLPPLSTSNGGRGSASVRRASFVSSFSHTSAVRSPSPLISLPPYNPNRISSPSTLYDPITPTEISRLKSIGMANNPLRKRKPLPSWSANPSRSQPMENHDSYFPPVEGQEVPSKRGNSVLNRRDSVGAATARSSVTPGRMTAPSSAEEVSAQAVVSGNSNGPGRTKGGSKKRQTGDAGSGHLKRPSGEDDERDGQRRKVSGGNAAAVASHYNSRPEVGVQHREFSPIIGLKKFNNWIKSVLIGKFAYQPPRGMGTGPGAKVLDIGCGKGGDLIKWRHAMPQLYVGMDLAETSIQQASERYDSMLQTHKMRSRGNKPFFDAFFFAHDCYARPISEVLPEHLQREGLYDNVTMQFCMHYAFENASKARMMIENVSRYLRKGGVFVGTIPNAEMILNRLEVIPDDSPSFSFGNACFQIDFVEKRHKGFYGHQYSFYLQDAVEDVPEYLVLWDNFVSEYGLQLVYKKTFNEVLMEEQTSRDFGPLLARMGVVDERGQSAMDENQWEAANLYMTFAFEKIRDK